MHKQKNKIPEGWRQLNFEEVCDRIQSGGTPLTTKKEFYDGKIPFVKIDDMTIAGKYLDKTNIKISKEGLENSSAWKIPIDSLLIAIYGSFGKVTINKIPLTTNQAILGIIPNKEKANLEYLYYLINSINLKRYAKQSTQANLTAEIIRTLKVFIPSSTKEQEAIALILSEIDKSIENSEKTIKKIERVKKGVMGELLTKGIGHKEFKDSEIGRIPKGREVAEINGFVDIQTGKRASGGALTEGRALSLGGEHIGKDGKVIWNINQKYIPEGFYNELKQGKVRIGDILIVKDGATTGKTAFVDEMLNKKVAVNEHVFIVRTKENNDFLNKYLFYILFSKIGQRQIKQIFHGMIGGIKRSDVESIKVPKLEIKEQQKIASILSTIDKKIELEKLRKEKLERIKKGLMNELLTGRKRVNVEKVLEVGE